MNYHRIAEFLLDLERQATARGDYPEFLRISKKLNRLLAAWKRHIF